MRLLLNSVLVSLSMCSSIVAMAEMPSAESESTPPALARLISLTPIELAHFSGDWTQIVDERDHESRIESIDSAVSDLSWLVRRMASGVLEKTTVPPEGLTFHWTGEALMQVVDRNDGVMQRPVVLDGQARTVLDHEGTDTITEWHRTSRGLEARWIQERAFGTTRYSLDPADETMHVEYEIHVTALEGVSAISYGSRFARKSLPAVSSAVAAQRPKMPSTAVSSERR
jgi:hypothetical protein